jgi:hypothetical protein
VFIVVWLPLRVTPVTPEAHLSVLVVRVRIDAAVFPSVGRGRQLHHVFRGYIWVRLRCNPQACSTPLGAFVRKLSASGYPLHLPQAMWVNNQTPTVGLEPISHTFYTAYPTNLQREHVLESAITV